MTGRDDTRHRSLPSDLFDFELVPGSVIDVWQGPWSISQRDDNTATTWPQVVTDDHDLVIVIAVVNAEVCLWMPDHGPLWVEPNPFAWPRRGAPSGPEHARTCSAVANHVTAR